MSLQEKIESDFKEAFKAGDVLRRSVLVMLKAAILNKSKEKGGSATLQDEDVLAMISLEIKRRRDAIPQYRAGGRDDVAEKEEKEIAILSYYLPPQLSDDEIAKIADEAIIQAQAEGEKDFGKVMAIVSPKTKGMAEGGRVAKIVKDRLLS